MPEIQSEMRIQIRIRRGEGHLVSLHLRSRRAGDRKGEGVCEETRMAMRMLQIEPGQEGRECTAYSWRIDACRSRLELCSLSYLSYYPTPTFSPSLPTPLSSTPNSNSNSILFHNSKATSSKHQPTKNQEPRTKPCKTPRYA